MLFGHGRVQRARAPRSRRSLVAFGTTLSRVLDPRASTRGCRRPTGYDDRRRRVPRDELARGDLQSVVPVPLRAHAAGVGADRVVPDRGPRGVAAAARRRRTRRRRRRCASALTLAAVLVPLQIFVGDLHGLNTLEHQPAKIAAIEAIWQTERGAPLRLFAMAERERRARTDFAIAVPQARQPDPRARRRRRGQGPERIPRRHPPVAPLFFAFRIMVGIGVLMLAACWARRVAATGVRGWDAPALPRALAAAARGDDLRRLAGDASRLVRHGDRPPAVHRVRPAAHRRRRRRRCRRR